MDEKICTNTIVYILIMCSIFLSSEDRSEGFIMVLILGGVFCFFFVSCFFFPFPVVGTHTYLAVSRLTRLVHVTYIRIEHSDERF